MLGSTASGSLRLTVDQRGLDYEADCPECRSDILEMVGRGDIPFSSFSFIAFDDAWDYADGHPQRTLFT